jgi:hypothetical protein
MGIPKSKGGMGFWDFRCFNKALLAKQRWQLWHTPDSLVSRIITAKYYADSSVLKAKLGNKLSYAWRSILGSCDLLKEGLFGGLEIGKIRSYGEINGFPFRQLLLSNRPLGC